MKNIEKKELKELIQKDPIVQELKKEISWRKFVLRMELRGWTIA